MSMLLKIKAYIATIDLAHGVGVAIGGVWRWMKGLPRRVLDACVAFIKTPAVWLSAPAFLFVGYLAGFALLEPKIIYLRDQARDMTKSRVTLEASLGELRRENKDLNDALRTLRETPPAVVAPSAQPVTKSPPAAGKSAPAKRKSAPPANGSSGWWW